MDCARDVGRGGGGRLLDVDDALDGPDLLREAVPDCLGRGRRGHDRVRAEARVDDADAESGDGAEGIQRRPSPAVTHSDREVASWFGCRHGYSPWSLDIHADCVGATVHEKSPFVKGFFSNWRGS